MSNKLILTSVLIALGASVAAADETPVRGGTFVFALTAEPPNFDCAAGATFGVLQTVRPHYSGLIMYDPDAYPGVKGDLAERWEISADKLAYTFHLHRDVKFHDGAMFSSQDVKATFDRIRKPPPGVTSLRQARFENVAGIETPDPQTVVFRLTKPDPSLISALASPWNCIYPADKLASDPRWPERNIIGTGPFKFVQYMAGSDWKGERFDGYFGDGKPYLDGFRIIFMNDRAVSNAVQGGQVDGFLVSSPPLEIAKVKQALGDRLVVQENSSLTKFEIFFNASRKPFDDPRVRRALSLAIDRWGGVKALSQFTTTREVGGVLRPGFELATSNDELAKLAGFGHDIGASRAQAQQLLADAGVPNLKFKLLTRSADIFTPGAVFLVDQWRRIGVSVETEAVPVGQQKANYVAGQYDVGFDADSYEDDEPSELLLRYVSKSRSPRNFAQYEDAEVDALYDAQKASTNIDERIKVIRQLERRVFEQAWIVPLGWNHRMVMLRSYIKGWKALPSQYLNQDLTDVWIDPKLRK